MRRFMLLAFLSLVGWCTRPVSALAESVESGYALEDSAVEEHLTFGSAPTMLQVRKLIDIPQDYGRVITIYPDTNGVVVWLESGDGKIHNVFVKWGKEPIVIQRRGKVQ